jgi:hypothetical protein
MDIEVNAGGDAGTQGRDSPVTRYGGQKIRFDLVFRTRFQIGFINFQNFQTRGELIEMALYTSRKFKFKYYSFWPGTSALGTLRLGGLERLINSTRLAVT